MKSFKEFLQESYDEPTGKITPGPTEWNDRDKTQARFSSKSSNSEFLIEFYSDENGKITVSMREEHASSGFGADADRVKEYAQNPSLVSKVVEIIKEHSKFHKTNTQDYSLSIWSEPIQFYRAVLKKI